MNNPATVKVSLSSSLEPPETTAALLATPNGHQRHTHKPHWDAWIKAQTALAESPETKLQTRAERINACCCAPMLLLTGKGKLVSSPGFCRDRLCPTCQQRRARDVAAKVGSLTVRMNSPRFLTLTLKSVDRPLFLTIAALAASFRVLRETTEWRRHVSGGVYVIEITRNAETECWHAHLHVIFDGQFWNQRDISRVWLRVTGDSPICDVRAIFDRKAAANYVAKYVSKPTDQANWPPSALREFAADMHGRRMLHTFGACYAEDVEDAHPEEQCIQAEPLVSANKVVHAARRGCAYARYAVELLSRCGGWLRDAIGPAAYPRTTAAAAPSDWEHERLVYCLRAIGRAEPDDKPARSTHWDDAAATERAYARRQLTWTWVPT